MPQRKSESARLNGAKSKGPKTPEGKSKSSRNAVRHGLTANFTVQSNESQEEFETFLDAFIDRYQPADPVELDLVQTLAITRWRLRRIAVIESDLLDNELVLSGDYIDEEFAEISDNGRLAWVFNKLAGESKALALLLRYETSLNRMYERTAKQLDQLQSSALRNEPKDPPTARNSKRTAGFSPREALASQPDASPLPERQDESPSDTSPDSTQDV